MAAKKKSTQTKKPGKKRAKKGGKKRGAASRKKGLGGFGTAFRAARAENGRED